MARVTNSDFNGGSDDLKRLKDAALCLQAEIERLIPEGRRQSIALTHLETSVYFAVRAFHEGDE